MATRALTAAVAGRRVAGQSVFPALASSSRRVGAHQSDSPRRSAHTQAQERNADHDALAAQGVTAAQVEAALNSKNVEEVAQEVAGARAATVLPDEVVGDDADAAWVPDQDTGVFVPAEEAACNRGADHVASVLDQAVFNREEEMEDVERPAVDMDNGDAK